MLDRRFWPSWITNEAEYRAAHHAVAELIDEIDGVDHDGQGPPAVPVLTSAARAADSPTVNESFDECEAIEWWAEVSSGLREIEAEIGELRANGELTDDDDLVDRMIRENEARKAAGPPSPAILSRRTKDDTPSRFRNNAGRLTLSERLGMATDPGEIRAIEDALVRGDYSRLDDPDGLVDNATGDDDSADDGPTAPQILTGVRDRH